ncbi:MAG: NAD-dependent epimerase/dehydratase family protein, partial [Chloroflexota bacterium]
MHIVVTGGAGFIGSHLCEALLAQGHSVTAIDNFLTGNHQNIAHLHDNPAFQLVEHDIVRPLDTAEINTLPPVDSVFHLASPASPADFSRIPLQIAIINSQGTNNVLEFA